VRKQIEKHVDINGKIRKTAKMYGQHTHSDQVSIQHFRIEEHSPA